MQSNRTIRFWTLPLSSLVCFSISYLAKKKVIRVYIEQPQNHRQFRNSLTPFKRSPEKSKQKALRTKTKTSIENENQFNMTPFNDKSRSAKFLIPSEPLMEFEYKKNSYPKSKPSIHEIKRSFEKAQGFFKANNLDDLFTELMAP